MNWERLEPPVLQPSGKASTIVYPFVLKENDRYDMWYGGHIEGGTFEIFHATSADGTRWKTDHDNIVFPSRPLRFGPQAWPASNVARPAVGQSHG